MGAPIKHRIIYIVVFAMLALSGLALGETYTYSGVNYDSASAPYTTDMVVSGSFTTSADIPANSVDYDLRPIISSWSFSDGVNTLTEANSELWDIGGLFPPVANTDSEGNITAIILLFHSPPTPHAIDDVIDRLQIRSDAGLAQALNDTICTKLTGDFCDGWNWSTPDIQAAQGGLGSWETGGSTRGPSPPPRAGNATAVPTLPVYGLILTALALLFFVYRSRKLLG